MNNTITSTVTSTDFFDIVRDVELDRPLPDQWQQRAIAWARFADRQRSTGFHVSIGRPG